MLRPSHHIDTVELHVGPMFSTLLDLQTAMSTCKKQKHKSSHTCRTECQKSFHSYVHLVHMHTQKTHILLELAAKDKVYVLWKACACLYRLSTFRQMMLKIQVT